MDKKKVTTFLVITFILAWTMETAASLYAVQNPGTAGTNVFRTTLMVLMYTPFVAALIVNKGLKGFGWKPKFKGSALLFLLCYTGPQIMAIIGAALFYGLFPDMLDFTGSYLRVQGEQMGVDLIAQLESQGMSLQTYYVVTLLAALFYAPLINMLLALGEEVGWRGFLYPELNKKFGRVTTWVIGGIIWAAFHYPVIVLAGYEYGTDYPGFPVVGILIFTVWCILLGMFEEMVYSKTKCIWYPALLHGAINAGAFVIQVMNAENPKAGQLTILGPGMNGLISMLPTLVLAIIVGGIVISKQKGKRV